MRAMSDTGAASWSSFPPSRDQVEPHRGFPCVLGILGVHVGAVAAAVDVTAGRSSVVHVSEPVRHDLDAKATDSRPRSTTTNRPRMVRRAT
jgi:hypothetical protein